MFVQLGEITFDRAVKPEGTVGAPELIGFADGSLDAYACVVYVRWLLKKTNVEDPDRFYVRLVCGKARVTPVKGTTVPRSELSGFLILTRLLKVVVNSMDEKPYQITTALDSQCTISAFERSGGSLAPYFASRVSEASSNLADLGEHSFVQPIMYVPGDLNPADLPTRANTRKEEVLPGSTWQNGPDYLSHSRVDWPFSRTFLDFIPEQELRSSKAAFNSADVKTWQCSLGPKLSNLIEQVMLRSNCLSKVTNVTARLLKCLFGMDRSLVQKPLTVEDIDVARKVLFIVSMGPSLAAMDTGKLDSLRPVVIKGIVYARS